MANEENGTLTRDSKIVLMSFEHQFTSHSDKLKDYIAELGADQAMEAARELMVEAHNMRVWESLGGVSRRDREAKYGLYVTHSWVCARIGALRFEEVYGDLMARKNRAFELIDRREIETLLAEGHIEPAYHDELRKFFSDTDEPKAVKCQANLDLPF